MYNEAHRLVAPRTLQRSFLPADLPFLADCLPGAETIILGVCTIGPALEERVGRLFHVDPAAAIILDEIGTEWVSGLGRQMHHRIRDAARAQGKRASPSYRPGIGHWPLALQRQILESLSAEEIGVTLHNGILIPQKTISMIVAVGTKLGRHCYAPGGNP